jgi:hypothetical protein
MDPFFAECRAYCAIIEHKRNGKHAVFCHGHVSLPATRELELAKRFQMDDWQRPDEEYSLPVAQRQPFRAIVKELVSDTVPFTKKLVVQMLLDLKALRRIFVYIRDVHAENYMGGKIVDFSSAWTAPHILISTYLREWDTIESDLHEDLEQFDEMIKDAGIVTWVRASPNPEYISRLRPRPQRASDDD